MAWLIKISFLTFYLSFWVLANDVGYGPKEIVEKAVAQARGGRGMRGTFSLLVHNAGQVKGMEYEYYSKGKDKTLIRFVRPASIRNQSMLMVEDNLWIYFPERRQVVRIPWSFRNRPWMGSDLSYDDFAKYPNMYHYRYSFIKGDDQEKHYSIKAEPLPRSPIVWGYELLTISDHWVIAKQQLYDQSQNLVKELVSLSTMQINDFLLVKELKVSRPDSPESFTVVKTLKLDIDVDLPDSFFSVAQLNSF